MSLAAGFLGGLAGMKHRANDRDARDAARAREARLDAARPEPLGVPRNSYADGPALSYGGGAAEPMGATEPTTGDPLLALMDRHEGGGRYDTLFGHAQRGDGRFAGVDVSRMTIGEVSRFADPSGEYGQWVKGQVGRVATPMGRFQIVGTTLRNTASALGLSPDTVFDSHTQHRMFHHLAQRRLAGAESMDQKMRALRAEWEGFKHVPDADLARAIEAYENQYLRTPPPTRSAMGAVPR